MNMLQLE